MLDAACGTGMHAVELARRGYSAAGADLFEGMVARARENAAAAGVSVNFRAAGFGGLARAFAAELPFDALLCLGNSLPHLLSREALAEALADFAACLRPGGLLLLQNRNFDAVMQRRERWMEPQAHQEEGAEWVFLRFYDYEPDGLINFNILTLRREEGQGWQQRGRQHAPDAPAARRPGAGVGRGGLPLGDRLRRDGWVALRRAVERQPRIERAFMNVRLFSVME